MKRIGLLFPNCNAARLLGIRLIDTQHIVAAFCLTQDDFNLADNMLEEMKIISMDQCQKLVGIGTPIPRLEIQTGVDFRDCDLLVLPSLDVLRWRPNTEYSAMLESHFREMKDRGLRVKDDTKIIFGSNQSGLVAGSIWGKVFPEQKLQILTVSSVYEASIKVFGKTGPSRAMPIQRKGELYFTDEVPLESDERSVLNKMGKASNIDEYSTLEATLLQKVIVLALESDDLEEIEVAGKFPSGEEAKRFKKKEGEIDWFLTNEGLLWWNDFVTRHVFNS